LHSQRAHLRGGHLEDVRTAQVVDAQQHRAQHVARDDQHLAAVGREQVEAVADLGGRAHAQLGGALAVAQGQHDGRVVQPVVGQCAARTLHVLHGEAGLPAHEAELVEDALDGEVVGGPLDGLVNQPACLLALDAPALADAGSAELDGIGLLDRSGGQNQRRLLVEAAARVGMALEVIERGEERRVEQQEQQG
jgi:hypothetical protein